MLIKPSKLVVFVFLIIGSLVPALAVAEVMVQFDTGFFGTVGKNTQKANGISLMSNYDIDLIEVSQDLGDGATVFQVTESSQIQGNDIPVNLIIHQGASKTTLEGTITWLWQPGGTVIMLGFVSNAGVEATITETNPDSGQAPRVYLVDGNFDDSNDLERGESGDTNIGLIFRGQTGHTFVDNENISGSANLNAVIDALNDYLADPVSQPANPALGITKTGTLNDDDGTTGLSAGDTISYAFTVTNTGNTTLTNIEVTDPTATVTGTTIASLASGASDTTSYTARYTLTQSDIDAGTFTNTATATGDGAGTDDVTNTGSDTQTLSGSSSLTLAKIGTLNDDDGTTGLSAGDTISYAFTVTNTGNTTLTNIEVTDPTATVTGTTIASLASGASDTTSYTARYTLTQSDIDAGTFTNTATATGDGAGTDDVTNTGSDTQTLSGSSSLTLAKIGTLNDDDGTTGLSAGDTISYAFTVTNTGNTTLTNIEVTDPTATVTGTTIASLASGASDTTSYTARYTLTQSDIDAGTFTNTATATGDGAGTDDVTNTGSDTQTLSGSSSLTLAKIGTLNDDDGTTGLSAGDTISYAFTVTNTGNTTLTNIEVTDPTATVTGTTIASLASGASDTTSYTARYTLTQSDIDAGTFTNTATATGDGAGTDDVTNTGSDTQTLARTGSLTLIKTASDPVDNDSNGVDAGDVITFTYVATNSGNVTLTNVSIAEAQADFTGTGTLPSPTYASGGSDQDSDSATDDLAVGESVTWTATYALTQADVNAGFVENQATATGSSPSGTGDVTDVSDDDGTNASDKTRKTFTGSQR